VSHQTEIVGADVEPADVVAKDDQDVRSTCLSLRKARRCRSKRRGQDADDDAPPRSAYHVVPPCGEWVLPADGAGVSASRFFRRPAGRRAPPSGRRPDRRTAALCRPRVTRGCNTPTRVTGGTP